MGGWEDEKGQGARAHIQQRMGEPVGAGRARVPGTVCFAGRPPKDLGRDEGRSALAAEELAAEAAVVTGVDEPASDAFGQGERERDRGRGTDRGEEEGGTGGGWR